jgi:glycine C-acetyltransferase
MSFQKLKKQLAGELAEFGARGTLKGEEVIITGVKQAADGYGPRYFLAGYGEKEFLRMNSNSYLGLSLDRKVMQAGEEAARAFGTGPGAVRFISGTYEPHVVLEKRLAAFHGREAAMLFSAAYSAMMGVLPPLITPETVVLSDELNHNCIINALRLSRPAQKVIYGHLSMPGLSEGLKEHVGHGRRAVVVTDGVFSMRGDCAPLDEISEICAAYEAEYDQGIITVVDDSHGVGALGKTGRGTEEVKEVRADILVATLGKAFGVNGGYAVAPPAVIRFLRETSPFYIYSNPIGPSEAAAAIRSLEVLDSPEGEDLLMQLRQLTARFENGLDQLGYETIAGAHPIVPMMVRSSRKTAAMVRYLFSEGVLATGINYPVVPKGDEEIRFQIAANHTEKDIDTLLGILERYGKREQRG